MAAMLPTVSIIMPTYNALAYLPSAIESVLRQTVQTWELIIVDDQSTDGTEAWVVQFLQNRPDARIRYYRSPSRLGSPAKAYNEGVALAQGQYVTFLDSDDMLYPDALEQYLRPFQQASPHRPAPIMTYGFLTCITPEGLPMRGPGYQLRVTKQGQYELPRNYQHTWHNVALGKIESSVAFMIRREALEAVHGFDEDLNVAEDFHLRLKLFYDAFDQIVPIPRYTYKYRCHPASLTRLRASADKLLSGHLQAINWLYQQVPLPEAAVGQVKAQAYAKRYRYVASVFLSQGFRDLALSAVIKGVRDRRISLWVAMTTFAPVLLRCAVGKHLEAFIRHVAVGIRDGSLCWQRRGP